jgi:four helix bundle protein
MSIDKLEVYNLAMILGEKVWLEVERKSHFQKDVIGKQLVRSTDSIAANIAEGYGRFFYKENKQFCYYSRGSILETKAWLVKAINRNLVSDASYALLMQDLETIHRKPNAYIKSIGQ